MCFLSIPLIYRALALFDNAKNCATTIKFIYNNLLTNTMKTKNLFEQEYVAPELEVISMSVEAGFSLSMGIADAEEDDFGDF